MEKNEPLSYRKQMLEMIKRVPERIKQSKISGKKQRIFKELHGLSGKEYQDKLNELRIDELMK